MIFDGDRELLGLYIAHITDEIGLRDWTIALKNMPCDEEHSGTCSPVYGRKHASIALSIDWMDRDEDELRHTIVHELLHCHTDAIQQPLEDIENVIGKMVHAPLMNAQHVALEFAVEAISGVIARYMPMPSEWLEQATGPEGVA